MLEQDFEQSVGYWAHMMARAFERALNEELAPHGITQIGRASCRERV